ncbi:hypothetical protein SporoP17a_12435 [Sporosarcina ureae]|nr:hypothetical protein SporoP17a_12435 [Sporosarcina ureae]
MLLTLRFYSQKVIAIPAGVAAFRSDPTYSVVTGSDHFFLFVGVLGLQFKVQHVLIQRERMNLFIPEFL